MVIVWTGFIHISFNRLCRSPQMPIEIFEMISNLWDGGVQVTQSMFALGSNGRHPTLPHPTLSDRGPIYQPDHNNLLTTHVKRAGTYFWSYIGRLRHYD